MFTDDQVQEIQEHLRQELQSLIKQAVDLKTLVTQAKTQTKRKYYTTKLEKINDEVAQRVILLQKLDDRRQAVAKGIHNGTPEDQAV